MSKILDYHDASIYKLEHYFEENKLVLGLKLHDSRLVDLTFENVIGWDFSPFSYQNYLMDFRIYAYDKLPQLIIEDYTVNKRYVEIMNLRKAYFFELNPASGMGGYVIAQNTKENLLI